MPAKMNSPTAMAGFHADDCSKMPSEIARPAASMSLGAMPTPVAFRPTVRKLLMMALSSIGPLVSAKNPIPMNSITPISSVRISSITAPVIASRASTHTNEIDARM